MLPTFGLQKKEDTTAQLYDKCLVYGTKECVAPY